MSEKTQTELIELVRQGKDAWNEWAAENKGKSVDFSGYTFDEGVSFLDFNFFGDANFSNTTFTEFADFNSTTFTGDAYFRNTTFSDDADFSSTTFTGIADFRSTTFTGIANFRSATFTQYTNFRNTKFTGDAYFNSTKFTGDAYFRGTTFPEFADFSSTKFTGIANFRSTTFTGDADFSSTKFTGDADFNSTKFTGDAYFRNTTFSDDADFSSTKFTGIADFSSTTFTGIANFSSTTFTYDADFTTVNIESVADYTASDFAQIPVFTAVKNPENIVLNEIRFNLPTPNSRFQKLCFRWFGLCSVESKVEPNIRTLRGIANKTYAIDVERDLGILERNAQAGTAWATLFKKSYVRKKIRIWVWELLCNLFTAVTMTSLLVAYRWSSNYGRSVLLPLSFLFLAPVLWFFIYFKLYLVSSVQNTALTAEQRFSALKSVAMSGALPIGNTLRPMYTASIDMLFGSASNTPLLFQIALTLQNITSLIFIFLIGLALRNFFRLK